MIKGLFDPIFLIQAVGPIGVFIVVFIESGLFFGFFFPGDSLLFTAGLLAASGFFPLTYLIIGCALAAILGGMIGYYFGEKVGPAIFSREDSFFFHKKHIAEAHEFFIKHGSKTIFLGRFLPIVRTFAPILAGVGGMNFRVFMGFNVIGASVWSVLLLSAGYFLGKTVPDIDRYILPIVIFIIVASFSPTIFSLLKKRAAKKAALPSEPEA